MIMSANVMPLTIRNWPQEWLPTAIEKRKLDPTHVAIIQDVDNFQMNWHLSGDQIHVSDFKYLTPYDYWVTHEHRPDTIVPKLSILCLRKISMYSLAYGGNSQFPNVADACYNPLMGLPKRLLKMFKTHTSFSSGYNFNDTLCAMKFYYTYCVELIKVPFTITKDDFDCWKPGPAKASLRKYETFLNRTVDDVPVKFTQRPTKKQIGHIIHAEVLAALDLAAEETKDGEIPINKAKLKRHVTQLALKFQRLSGIDEGSLNTETLEKIGTKARLFFMSADSALHILFKCRHQERTYAPDCFQIHTHGIISSILARNNTIHIDIGSKWIDGGGYCKFLQLMGDSMDKYLEIETGINDASWINKTYQFKEHGDMMCADFDIETLDLNISAVMLMLYMLAGQLWYIKDMRSHAYRIYMYLLEGCAEQLAGKVVTWLKDFIMLIGVMPSGSLETSHGDSWIVGVLMYLTFIFYTMRTSMVDDRKKIWQMLCLRKLVALITGDDSLYAYPRDMDDLIGVDQFCIFCENVFRLKFKSKNKYFSLITYLRVRNSLVVGYVYKGPVYLKRRFILASNFNLNLIEKNIAIVVPWRPFEQYKWRMAIPKDNSDPFYKQLPRYVGLVYDTLGVEPQAYYAMKFGYEKTYIKALTLFSPDELAKRLQEWIAEDKKYLYKIGMSGQPYTFPSRRELLKRNIFDRDAHRPPHGPVSWQMWAKGGVDLGYMT